MVARIDAPIGQQPTASLIATAEKLLQEHAGAKSKRQSKIIATLAALGKPLRPYLNRVVGGDAGLDPAPYSSMTEEHAWPARRVFAKMLADEVAAPSKALHHSEVAIAKAIAEVAKRIKVHGPPWYARKQVRCVNGIWFVRVHGTFQVSNDWKTANQEGVNAGVAFRAKDGKLLQCKIRRGNDDVNELIKQNAPGVILVEDQKK